MSQAGKVLFVLQVVGHPRDSKRIAMLQQEGFDVEAAAFERDYHKGRKPLCKVTPLGRIAHGKYASRLFRFLGALPTLRRAIASNDIVYASGQDVAFLAYIAGLGLSRPIIMEVGDLVGLQLSQNMRGKLFRKFDRWITSRYALLVVISEGFLNTYYRKWLDLATPSLVIQNKLEPEQYNFDAKLGHDSLNSYAPLLERPLRIGYFGLLRDFWSWQVLSTLAELYPQKYEIVFAGYPINPCDIDKRVADCPNMTYLGEYRSPEDLPSIYRQVDMIWACYPEIKADDWNLRWGRPNRFYESCFFSKPCFAREGSLFAEDVKRYGIGYLIRDVDVKKVVEELSEITPEVLSKWRQSMARLPQDVYLYTNESQLLSSEIMKLRPSVN